ncbi:MAG: sugar transferase [Acidobacteria bacterium]|nr:sugar transferase [Acidobacteriota bacterium]
MSITHITIEEGSARLIFSLPFPSASPVSFRGLRLQLKLALDFLGALALLVLTAPIFLLAAGLIKLTSPGPVFFRQERPGIYQRRFRIWKFRTMANGSEKEQRRLERDRKTVFFKPCNDPRVTQVGQFLRKYSIDELPQLFNVLKGEMSLVGPRPILECELRRFGEWEFLRRFSMKPGLTCIWQVSGRSNTSDWDRIRQDLEYVDSWSLLLDIKLLAKTVREVFRATGAR